MTDPDELVEDFVELYFENDERYQLVREGIEPVSNIVLYLSVNGADFVRPGAVTKELYDIDPESLDNDLFGTEYNMESIEAVDRVLEYGVSLSPRVDPYPRRGYKVPKFDVEDYSGLVNAAEMAQKALERMSVWSGQVDMPVENIDWKVALDEQRAEEEQEYYESSITEFM